MVVGVKSETNSAGHGVAGSQVTESPARTSRCQGQRFQGKSLVIVEPPRAATAPLRDLWIPGCRSPGNLPSNRESASQRSISQTFIPPISVSTSRTMTDAPSVLPNGPLYGYYSHKRQPYTIYSGSSDIVRHTPTPEEAPVIDNNTINPFFRQPRYLSLNYPYLLFIPRNYPWRDNFFKIFDRPRHKLPIISDEDNGFCLHHDVAEHWLRMELCLRALGNAMFQLAPQQALYRFVNSWFFPARFKFLLSFRSERAARFAAACSRDNFLPLLGYVSMGLWCMHSWETAEVARGADPLDWRSMITEKTTKVHLAFLSYLEESVVGNWREEHVRALYRIPAPEGVHYKEREARRELEWLLGTILCSTIPGTIPIYLSWGNLPRQISSFDVPPAFLDFVPDTDELEYLASSPQGELIFSRWTVDSASLVWYRDPYMPPVAPAPPPTTGPDNEHQDSAAPAVEPAPFPPLPAHSKQKKNETIQAFFARRREGNLKRSEHAKKGQVPSKARVFVWEEQDGHYIRQPGGRGNYEDLWSEYNGPQRRFDPISNEWDLCEIFENNDPVFGEGYDEAPSDDDDDDDDDTGNHPIFPQNIDMASRLPPKDDSMQVVQTHLKSMRNPSEEAYYYVVSKIGSGIGREALLIPRATDLIEILRQQWGPELKDVAQHLLARGIPFRLAYVSTEIMPARETPAPLSHRPKGFIVDTSSGLGFRPENYKFDVHDYNAYTTQHDLQLLHTPRGRIALQYGSVIGRLARSEVSDDDFFRGFSDDIYDVGDCLWNGVTTWAYWHDRLFDHEIDLLCGVYHVRTGQKRGGGKDKGKQGHGQDESDAEQTFIVHGGPNQGVYILQRQSVWRHNLKFQKDVKKCWDGYEIVASSIVDRFVDMGAILS
ncbi:hypothetical protein B0H10DRAFT_1968151 [Mycena sp. CBHHK59/15]|nr:hypothetical protein B0H10DRAFT_1968151 [Mycena sp. CBHHK59/15]